MHYRLAVIGSSNASNKPQFMSLNPITNFTDVAKVFFVPADFEMWDLICQSNKEYSDEEILEFSRSLMLKQGKIFESIQASILIAEIKKNENLPSDKNGANSNR